MTIALGKGAIKSNHYNPIFNRTCVNKNRAGICLKIQQPYSYSAINELLFRYFNVTVTALFSSSNSWWILRQYFFYAGV